VTDGGPRPPRWPVATAKKFGGVAPVAVERFFTDQCAQHAAAIAYRVLFSVVPLAIVLASAFGLVLQDDSVRHDVTKTIADALPVSAAGREDVEDALSAIATPASAAGLISLAVFAWAATGMMSAIRQGLESAMSVRQSRPMARGKVVDLVLIVGTAALVLVTAGITVVGQLVHTAGGGLANATDISAGTISDGVIRVFAFVLSVLVVMLLYRFVPARGLRIRDGLTGAILTALVFQLIALASGFFYDRATRLSVVYGSLTAALVFLYSVYVYACALLLGAEVAAAWARPPSGPGAPLLTQLKRAFLGLFVQQETPRPREGEPPPPG
jgi:membrane protein